MSSPRAHQARAAADAALAGAEAGAHRYLSDVVRRRATVSAAVGALKSRQHELHAVPERSIDWSDAPASLEDTSCPSTPSSPSRSPKAPRVQRLTLQDLRQGEPDSLQQLLPCVEPDPNFPDFEEIIAEEAGAAVQPRLSRARARYRRAAKLDPVRYEDIVNLAACHQLLGQSALALPLLAQATRMRPARPSGHVNQVLCLSQLGDRAGAIAAIRFALAEAEDLTDGQHTQLLRCKAAVLRGSAGASKKGKFRDFGCTPEAGGSSEVAPSAEPLTMDQLRAGLRALRSPEEAKKPLPPWGRIHAYADDEAITSKDVGARASWQPLLQGQLDVLRRNLGVHEPGSFEREECAKVAYEAAKSLVFLKRLLPEQGILVLAAADFVEIEKEEYLFKQGDLVDFMYIIASGSVRVEIFQDFSDCPVVVDTLFDGQLFGEQAAACEALGSKFRRASILAQERTCLIRLLPVDYRRIMGAPESSDNTYGLPTEPSPEELHLQANSVPRRASARRQAMPDSIRLRLDVLKQWPFLVGVSDYALAILASNVQEVQLRQGDEFVRVGQTLEGCFLLLEGVCKVFIRPQDVPEDGEQTPADSPRLGVAGCLPQGARGLSAARAALTPRAPDRRGAGRRCASARPHSHRELRKALPRPGRPWETTLRAEPLPEVIATPNSEEISLSALHAGQAFGFCALTLAQGDISQMAGARVRVDSSTARLIVLTTHSLLYLPDSVSSVLLAGLTAAEDPVRPQPKTLREARRRYLGWAVMRERVLRAQLATTA